MKKLFIAFISILSCTAAQSQAPANWTSAEMYQALKKLNVLGSVLYVAAHPDDENTRLIAYLSKDRLYRTGYLSLTRGDGGQNLIGEEQGIELGLIRTQELLAARRIDGGEQFFTRAYDFGYSKTPRETFDKWDREKILADVVWVIRKFQPDVIVTRFPATGEGGHGHHTASAILANEAFDAAADPSRFPEQLQWVQPWKASRVLWNTFNFGGNNTTRADQFRIDVGGYNPLLGKGYGEIAAESRSQHKSQGFGVPAGRGEALEYFATTKGTAPEKELLDGTNTGWSRVPGASHISQKVTDIISAFDFLHPEKSVQALVELHGAIAALPASGWRDKKLEETAVLIRQCSGLFLDATGGDRYAVQDDSIRFSLVANNRLGLPVSLKRIGVRTSAGQVVFDSTLNLSLKKNINSIVQRTSRVSGEWPVTQPYWLKERKQEGYFVVNEQPRIGQPDVEPAFTAELVVEIGGREFNFPVPVRYRYTDPVRGEQYDPLVIIPSVLITPDNALKISVGSQRELRGELQLTAKKKDIRVKMITGHDLRFGRPDSVVRFTPANVELAEKNETVGVGYSLKPGSTGLFEFYTSPVSNGHVSSGQLNEIRYDHIPGIVYFEPAAVEVRKIDVAIHHRRIGYIPGAGDKVPEALEQMGFEVTLLTEKEMKNDLDKFDAIITGVRAYNTNEWMNRYYEKLKKYVHEGGNLIVQYNTSNQIGPVRAKIAPYPFNISRTRVTDETAPVTILKPGHPVFNYPNKITNADFEGWIQERSIYHATGWDSTKFETLLSMNDPGEKADEGSLIVARHGKGVFTYTGIVFFRQLPAGVPGAYRLLANLIALNRKKGF